MQRYLWNKSESPSTDRKYLGCKACFTSFTTINVLFAFHAVPFPPQIKWEGFVRLQRLQRLRTSAYVPQASTKFRSVATMVVPVAASLRLPDPNDAGVTRLNPITLVYHPVLLVTVLPTMEDDLKLFHMLQLEITPRLYEEIPGFHTTAKLVHIKLRDARIKIKIHPLTYYCSGCKSIIPSLYHIPVLSSCLTRSTVYEQ
jgi:hypothetical protein